MKAVTVPVFLRIFYPSLLWQMPAGNQTLYLTFDDGPHPEITPKVLDLLDQYQAKATFFCVGENVERFPQTYAEILNKGHRTGNHTMNHLNGWKTNLNLYYENVNECRKLVDSDLLRPPYGRITPAQIQALKKEYKIVMWSVLSYDFDTETTPEQCLNYVIEHAEDGAIIVFHDSEKSARNMLAALPEVLSYYHSKGYQFEKL
ncbi:MAG TPA: polysaccharide deacetylase family protein [Bacteroidales bacterium]|jgi:peptidoglycan/xylan/chitin deacetylase (PgdA/CDA1 family)|nr:polysaccharide deacetylase family protein [Bacteroidales bacterium]MDD4087777.1 polysaccharide deacetylase family protein [Bacteroidales bacterium]MDY0084966.1 polysaccharide deacetylase family protein [Bacteroidales bacterium]HPE42511.1 polysaccharide deacetylase family protein [Bacteroidales bacterium]